MTLEEAKGLELGTIVYSIVATNADGTPQRWRVGGVPKVWKRNSNKVRVPVKHGIYDFSYITEEELHLVTLDEAEAIAHIRAAE